MPTVCAVVLTYNRKDLLRDCLTALRRQTRPCDRILVVDNASSDGTAEMLAAEWAGVVETHILPQNVGAAGGYNACMRFGHQTGADYIWAMDDDVIAEPDALERLLAAEETLLLRGIAAPFVISTACAPGGLPTNVPEIDRRRNTLAYENWPALLGQAMVPVTRATFVGILLPRATLERHGLPIAAMFIWGEDSELTLRITRTQPGYLVGDSRVLHVRQVAGALDIRTETAASRIAYHFHRIRNDVYLKRRYEGRRAVARYLRQHALLALRLGMAREFTKARIVLRALAAGLAFNPVIEVLGGASGVAELRPVAAPVNGLAAGTGQAV